VIFIGGNVSDFACGKTDRFFRSQMLTAAINNKKNLIAIWMSMMLMNTTGLKRAGAEQDIFSTYCLPLKSARPASRCYPWFFGGRPPTRAERMTVSCLGNELNGGSLRSALRPWGRIVLAAVTCIHYLETTCKGKTAVLLLDGETLLVV
jgi:hypothetical protein